MKSPQQPDNSQELAWRLGPTDTFCMAFKRKPRNAIMGSFHEYMDEYKKQMEKGAVQKAYQGLMEYVLDLRAYFNNHHPDYSASGSIYYGYLDMTYFPLFPKPIKDRKLKIAIVFIHAACIFEIAL